jgi:hypothetical protein
MAEVIYAGDAGLFKTCTKCGDTKLLGEYHQDKGKNDGKSSICKLCAVSVALKWRQENPERVTKRKQIYRAENLDVISARGKVYRQRNIDGLKVKSRAQYQKDPSKFIAKAKDWALENPEKRREIAAKHNVKKRSTPKGKLENSISCNMRNSLKTGGKQGRKAFDLLGYSISDLMAHLEKKFAHGMSWENYGQWHVDHIIPLAAHNYETPECADFKRAWALSNLQPLWALENISKGAKLSAPFQPSLAL